MFASRSERSRAGRKVDGLGARRLIAPSTALADASAAVIAPAVTDPMHVHYYTPVALSVVEPCSLTGFAVRASASMRMPRSNAASGSSLGSVPSVMSAGSRQRVQCSASARSKRYERSHLFRQGAVGIECSDCKLPRAPFGEQRYQSTSQNVGANCEARPENEALSGDGEGEQQLRVVGAKGPVICTASTSPPGVMFWIPSRVLFFLRRATCFRRTVARGSSLEALITRIVHGRIACWSASAIRSPRRRATTTTMGLLAPTAELLQR